MGQITGNAVRSVTGTMNASVTGTMNAAQLAQLRDECGALLLDSGEKRESPDLFGHRRQDALVRRPTCAGMSLALIHIC